MFGILLVENDLALRQTIAGILRSTDMDLQVLEAANGAESFCALSIRRIDLVVMDIRLKGENGLALAGQIKARYPNVVMVIHSVHDGVEYRRTAEGMGADFFLSKTTNSIDDMLAIIRSACRSAPSGL